MLWGVNHLRLAGSRELLPPFLHFIKPKVGILRFSGLCMLRDDHLAWHGEEGKPVRNIRLALDILDLEEVYPEWLKGRSLAETPDVLDERAPQVWKDAIRGKVRPLRIWRSGIRNRREQMPIAGSDDAKVLEQLRQLSGHDFERLVVAIVDLMPEIVPGLIHEVEQTQLTADRGIDMLGFFRLPEPISYVIPFKGEVKNWKSAPRPKHASSNTRNVIRKIPANWHSPRGLDTRNHVRRYYANFSYQAQSCKAARRVVAKVEWHPGELYPRVGFIVTNMTRPVERVVGFYNQRGTAEQHIKEGKNAIKWTRLSCCSFAANAVRLQLHALAYNLANFMRTLALPEAVKQWSLTSLREKLVKIGAKVVRHGRYVIFQMAEVAVPRELFQEILRLIDGLRPRPAPA